jgi:hypothetical protein
MSTSNQPTTGNPITGRLAPGKVLLKDPRIQPLPDLRVLVEDTLKAAGGADIDTCIAEMEKKAQDDQKQKIIDYEEQQECLNTAAATVLKALQEQEEKDAAEALAKEVKEAEEAEAKDWALRDSWKKIPKEMPSAINGVMPTIFEITVAPSILAAVLKWGYVPLVPFLSENLCEQQN